MENRTTTSRIQRREQAGPRGFTLLELMIVLAIIGLLVSSAMPRLMSARKLANETAAKASLKAIYAAQDMFREGDKDQDQIMNYAGDLQTLARTGVIDDVLGSGLKHGYRFRILPSPNLKYAWSAVAVPDAPGKTGDASFFVDDTGVIRFSTTETAGPASPPIGQ